MSTEQVEASSVPRSVDRAYWLLVLALAAGVVEMIAQASTALQQPEVDVPMLSLQLCMRLTVYAAVLFVMGRFRQGKRWSRIALGFGLGFVGIASLISEPLAWAFSGDPLPTLTQELAVIACARTIHIVAVVGAVVLMLAPEANRYFGSQRRSNRLRALGSAE